MQAVSNASSPLLQNTRAFNMPLYFSRAYGSSGMDSFQIEGLGKGRRKTFLELLFAGLLTVPSSKK